MKLHKNIKVLSLYIDGELDRKLSDSVAAHLEACEECRTAVERLTETKKLLAETQTVRPPANLAKQIMDSIPETASTPLRARKLYLPALGTIALLVVVSLVTFNRNQVIKRAQGVQIAKAPVQEKPADATGIAAVPELQYEKSTVDEVKGGNDKKLASGPEEYRESFNFEDKSTAVEKSVNELPALSKADRDAESEVKEAEKTKSVYAVTAVTPSSELKKEEQFCIVGEDGKAVCENISRDSVRKEVLKTASAKPLPNAIVIRNSREWTSIWTAQNTAQNLTLPLPDVDFKEKMVVAVPSRQAENEYTVVNAIEEKDKIIIQYKEQPLQKITPLPYQLNVVNQKPAVELQKLD